MALAALSQGGTCLRILYKLSRFSEDLDFSLLKADPKFEWQQYSSQLQKEFEAFGLKVEIQDRSKLGSSVKAAFIKQDSIGQILSFQFPRDRSQSTTIRIKLEVDSNPPAGASCDTKMIDFPYPCLIMAHD